MDWTRILKQGGVPEPPGYHEAIEAVKSKPKKKKAKGKKKR